MSAWDDATAAALLGTGRQPFTPPVIDGSLGFLFRGLNAKDEEGALLGVAVALRLYQRAGQPPRICAVEPAPPCDLDDLPICTARAGDDLATMLAGEHQEVIGEWLTALASTSRRVPAPYLPDLLTLSKKQPTLRDLVTPVLGARGRWLSELNPEWRGQVEADEERWGTTGIAERLTLLHRTRAGDPHHARELLASTWASEPGETRAVMLATFTAGLSLDDEPFLETCLDDRAKEVRRIAAKLLAALPGSRLCLRMIERVRTLVNLRREHTRQGIGWLGRRNDGLTFDVALPDACTVDMVRDGVTRDRPPQSKVGERAWWLRQMIGSIAPSYWCATAQATPSELLHTIGEEGDNSAWRSVLLEGLAQATCRHGDATWAEALLASPASLQGSDGVFASNHEETSVLDGLLSVLPPLQWEANVVLLFASISDPLKVTWIARFMDHLSRRPWTLPVTRAFFTFLHACHAAGAQRKAAIDNRMWMPHAIKHAARRIPPSLLSETAAALSTVAEDASWNEAIQDCLTLLQFRHDMLEEIAR